MKLKPQTAPREVAVAAEAFLRADRRFGQRGHRVAGWHRRFVPHLDASDVGGIRVAFAGWCCLLVGKDGVEGRLSVSMHPPLHITGVGQGPAVTQWVTGLVAAEAFEQADSDAAFEPGWLSVPDGKANGVLLLPVEDSHPILVWSVMKFGCDCAAGLQTLERFLADCAQGPRAQMPSGVPERA